MANADTATPATLSRNLAPTVRNMNSLSVGLEFHTLIALNCSTPLENMVRKELRVAEDSELLVVGYVVLIQIGNVTKY